MSKELEELKKLAYENACCRCQYYIDNKCINKGECVWLNIETALIGLSNIIILCKEYGIDFINYNQVVRRLRIELNNARKYNYNDYSMVIKFAKENGKKLKAFEIIKKYPRCSLVYLINYECAKRKGYSVGSLDINDIPYTQEEYDIVIQELEELVEERLKRF